MTKGCTQPCTWLHAAVHSARLGVLGYSVFSLGFRVFSSSGFMALGPSNDVFRLAKACFGPENSPGNHAIGFCS